VSCDPINGSTLGASSSIKLGTLGVASSIELQGTLSVISFTKLQGTLGATNFISLCSCSSRGVSSNQAHAFGQPTKKEKKKEKKMKKVFKEEYGLPNFLRLNMW
jgi:hypothetical protein